MEYERACSCLKQAEGNASMDFWDVVANRLYYAVFHAVSALLIKDGYKVGTHKGAMLIFGQNYVKTGMFTAEDSKLYSNHQMMREGFLYIHPRRAAEKGIGFSFSVALRLSFVPDTIDSCVTDS